MDQRLTPYFTVSGADEFIDFARRVFGADLILEKRNPDGTVQHARLGLGGGVVMLNEATEEFQPNESQMHLHVDDVGKTYALALENGGTGLMEPMLRPHGDIMAGFRDTCGNRWWVAEPGET